MMKIFLHILLIGFTVGFATINETLVRPSWAEPWGKSAPGTYIDVHNHLSGGPPRRTDYFGAARNALAEMDTLGMKQMIIMPPPFSAGHRGLFEIDDLLPVVKSSPDRIAVLGGGGSLNVMIHEAAKKSPSVTPETKARFEKKAAEIISGGAIGFGEIAIEHFSFNNDHAYEATPADHPLFLLLADLAARYNVPLDIHMEAIPKDMPLPDRNILRRSGNNPQTLKENLPAWERLLAHNRKARIIWAHAGWCNTGFRTPALCRELFQKHPNLSMSFKLSPDSIPETRPISEGEQTIKPEWLQLIKDFPDRFLLGTDQFYVPPGARPIGPRKTEGARSFMSLLPPDLSQKIGLDNPIRIFNLKK